MSEELIIKVESLKNMLVTYATGGRGDPVEYKSLRQELITWRGRIRACRWIGATLSREQTEAFDREHEALLERIAPARFVIPHRITIRIFETSAG